MKWEDSVTDWFETGSRVVCDPPVTGTDRDIVCLVECIEDIESIIEMGFEYGGSFDVNSEYHSLRNEDLNLILILSKSDFEMFRLATKVSKLLNILDKKKRVCLFEAIRHGEFRYE